MTVKAPPISEKAFMRQVIDLAHLRGWDLVYHPWISVKSESGWPDLCLTRVKDGRMVLAELKAESGKLTPRQAEVLDILRSAVSEVYVWRPSSWNEIESVLV
jgi:hypothetical protein